MFIQRIGKIYHFYTRKGGSSISSHKNLSCLESAINSRFAGQPDKQTEGKKAFKKYRSRR